MRFNISYFKGNTHVVSFSCFISVTTTHLHAAGGYANGPTYSSCMDDRKEMQEYYIDKLSQSHFRQFCKKFQKECIPENVSVKC